MVEVHQQAYLVEQGIPLDYLVEVVAIERLDQKEEVEVAKYLLHQLQVLQIIKN